MMSNILVEKLLLASWLRDLLLLCTVHNNANNNSPSLGFVIEHELASLGQQPIPSAKAKVVAVYTAFPLSRAVIS